MTVRIRQSMVIDSTSKAALNWAKAWVEAWTTHGWEKAGTWSDNGDTVAEVTCEIEVGEDAEKDREG